MSDQEFESRLKMMLRLQKELAHLQIGIWIIGALSILSFGFLIFSIWSR